MTEPTAADYKAADARLAQFVAKYPDGVANFVYGWVMGTSFNFELSPLRLAMHRLYVGGMYADSLAPGASKQRTTNA